MIQFVTRLLRHITLAGAMVACGTQAAFAQAPGVSYDGTITGSIGTMAYKGRIPVANPPEAEMPDGAHYTVEHEGADRLVSVRLTALDSRAPPRRGSDGFYGDNAVRIELGFFVPASAAEGEISSDMLEWASLSFVEVWPSRVKAPALQYNTMYTPPELSINTLAWTVEGIHLTGTLNGVACLYFYDADEHGNRTPSAARVMGEGVCPAVDMAFSATAKAFGG